MLPLNGFLIFVACLCCILSTSTAAKNNDMVDLFLIFDMVPRVSGYNPNQGQGQLLSEFLHYMKDEMKIDSAKTRMAIAVVRDEEEIQNGGKRTLEQGSDKQSIETAANFLEYVHITNATANDMNKVIGRVKEQLLSGGRSEVPDLVVYIAVFPKSAIHGDTCAAWFQAVDSHFSQITHSADIVMTVTNWVALPCVWIKSPMTPSGGTVIDSSDNDRGGQQLTTEIGATLHQCEYDEGGSNKCFYPKKDETTCIKEMKYIPKLGSSHKYYKYCLKGDANQTCDPRECEKTCNEKQKVWISRCDCNTSRQYRNFSAEMKGKLYDNCPPEEISKPCMTRQTCFPFTTTERPMYMLAMPVWAIFVVTFCLILLLVVIATLWIYYGCFPKTRAYTADTAITTARTGRWGRMRDTMRSFMQSFGRRRGATSRNNTGRPPTVMRGGRSMAPTTTYTDRTRR